MNMSITTLLGLGAALLLLAQGITTLWRPNVSQEDGWLGWLAILIAALGLLAQLLLYIGALVVTPLFGNVIVQGHGALVALNLLMVGIAVSAGIWLSAVRMRVGWPANQWRWVTLGLLFGISTWVQMLRILDLRSRVDVGLGARLLDAIQVIPINPSDPSPLHVFAYDLRWPPMLAWLSYCMIESLLALVLFIGHPHLVGKPDEKLCNTDEYRELRGWVGSLSAAVQSIWAFNQPSLSPRSLLLWKVILGVAITYNVFRTLQPLIGKVAQQRFAFTIGDGWHKVLRRGLIVFLGSISVCLCIVLFSWVNTQPQWRAVIISGVIILLAWSWLPLRRGLWMRQTVSECRRVIATDGKRETRAAILLMALVASLIGLFYDFYGIGAAIPLLCFFLACIAFNDIVVEHGLRYQLRSSAAHGRLYRLLDERSAFRVRVRRTSGGFGGAAKSIAAWFNQLLNLRTAALALVKLLIAIIVLLAVSEFVNSGKTIVQPFTISGVAQTGDKPESTTSDLAQSISDRLVGNLGALGQKLQPDTIILSPGVRGGVQVRFINAGANAGSVDAVLAQNSELDIGGVKVPASLFVAPIREPVRFALNVRTISGRIQDDGDSFTLLALSNKGETWISRYPRHDLSQAVISGTEQLAFDILSDDPTFASYGMTHSWEAFQRFLDGLDAWNAFEASHDKGQLERAIKQFKSAADADHAFALAFYRHGIALQQRGDPNGAIAAFRSSIAANPKFVPAYNALAYTLYNFVEYDSNAPSAILPLAAPSGEQARAEEARRQWQQIALFPADTIAPYERASAYYGLCLDAADQNQYQLAYFYCERAESIYGDLSASVRSDLRIKQAEAAVLNTLGVAVMRLRLPHDAALQFSSVPEVAHSCLAVELDDGSVAPPPSSTALGYFEHALSLKPDDPNIRCNLAGADSISGNRERAQSLDADTGTLRSLAESYRILAKKYFFLSLASDNLTEAANQPQIMEQYRDNAETQRATALAYYRMALAGYQKVLDHDPLDTQALLGYAYTIWQWRFEQLHTLPIEGPSPDAANNAVSYARRAAALADAGGPPAEVGLAHARFGAVLLGQLDLNYAIRELQRALQDLQPTDPGYNETNWMLAQATFCKTRDINQAKQILIAIEKNTAAADSASFVESRYLDMLQQGKISENPILGCTLDGA